MTQDSYSFQFIGTDTTCADKFLREVLVYAFRSEKSNHQYQVNNK